MVFAWKLYKVFMVGLVNCEKSITLIAMNASERIFFILLVLLAKHQVRTNVHLQVIVFFQMENEIQQSVRISCFIVVPGNHFGHSSQYGT